MHACSPQSSSYTRTDISQQTLLTAPDWTVQVLMAAAKVASKGNSTPFDELANQASLKNGAGPQGAKPAALIKPGEQKRGVLASSWHRIQGFFTGILVALITSLYMVRSSLSSCSFAGLHMDLFGTRMVWLHACVSTKVACLGFFCNADGVVGLIADVH